MSKFSSEINTVQNTHINLSVKVPYYYGFLFSPQIIMHGREWYKYQDHYSRARMNRTQIFRITDYTENPV